jgi:diguanylate cyclase (GGDEF)-like protein
VAQVLKASVGDEDVVARYGGEEFVIATTGKTYAEINQTAERIRTNVEQTSLEHAGVRINVTLSAGVSATSPSTSDPPLTSETLIARADKAMYVAKGLGRNRVQLLPLSTTDSGEEGRPFPELPLGCPCPSPASEPS